MDFKNYLQTSAEEINQELETILVNYKSKAIEEDSRLEGLVEIGINSARGGKRIRAVLIKLGYEIALGGKKINPGISKAATSIELFQAGVLAHDDIIDLSPTRRGEPSVYMKLGGDHHAISQTICLGDMGIFLSFLSLSTSSFSAEVRVKAIEMFSKMATNTVFGEMLDVELPYLDIEKTEDDVLKIHRLKTAYYTIVFPLQIGGVLGGASDDLLTKFEKFGEALGIAFQIQDDILGVFGNEEELGKSVTSDIEEGKNTLLITEALKNADQEQKKVLDEYYGRGKIEDAELGKVRQVFEQTAALEYSRTKAVEYVSRAKQVIPEITGDVKYQQLLNEMADFLIERKK